MKIEQINTNLLKPYKHNSKQHPIEQIDKLAKIIQKVGFNVPIIIDENAEILAGHGRLLAAERLGLETVPCHRVMGLTENDKKAWRIADNQISISDWNDYLPEELKALQQDDYDMELTGFSNEELAALDSELGIEEDDVEEDDFDTEKALAEPKYPVLMGQVYQLGEHRLMCGDSTDSVNVYNLIKGDEISLLLTDPPYGISIVNKSKVGISGNTGFVGTKGLVKAKQYKEVIGDDKPFDPSFLIQYGIHQIIFGANNFCSKLEDNSHWIVWDKKCEKGADHNNFSDCELAWTNVKAKTVRVYRYLWSGLLREGSRDLELKERVHPTQKPVGLMSELVKDYSNDGITLDLFGGSGSTLIACEQLNRKCYMMELDTHYCSVIIERWENLTSKKAVKI